MRIAGFMKEEGFGMKLGKKDPIVLIDKILNAFSETFGKDIFL